MVALGDILNTRESVSVQALASAFEFFERLGNAIPGHVHIILGNHDMNLKHSGRVSSLDALSMTPMRDKFRLYRDMQVTEIDGRRAVMLPYQEHQTLIRDWVEQMSHEHALHEMTAFGHLSVNGAIQRYQADNAGNVYLRKYVEGDREHGERALGNNTSNNNGSGGSRSGNGSGGGGSGAVNVSSARVIRGNRFNVQQQRVSSMKRQSHALPSYLNAMKRVFTGHFHHHHVLGEDGKVVYCGAPLQHHFGDSGDFGRGVIVYEPDSDKFEFVQNPAWDVFRTVRVSSEADLEPVSQYKGKRVSVIYENLHLVPDKIQSLLLDNGAAEVKKHSISVKRVSSSIGAVNDAIPAHERDNNTTSVDQHDINHIQNLEDFVDHYVALYDISEPTFSQKLVTLGKQIIRECSAKHNLNRSSSKTFDARLKSLTIENFLGVQGVLHFDFESMEDGIWFLQGVNGSGKVSLACADLKIVNSLV